MTNDRINQTAR